MPVMGLSVYMYVWDAQALVGILHNQSAWAGFTLLILTWGQCEGLILGIGAERNFTPTSFFVSELRYSGSISIVRMLMK